MSQKKMEAYKEAKKNVKQIRKKEKRNRIIAWVAGILIAAALIAASVFLVYYTNVIKPEQDKAAEQAESDKAVNDVLNIIQNNGEDADAGSADAGSTADTTSDTAQ